VREVGLGILGVEGSAVNATARRASYDHRDADAGAVARLGGEVGDHVEGARDEVGELHLGDRPQSHHGRADRRSHDRALGERRVEHALFSEAIAQAGGELECPSVHADVFAEQEDAVVALHLLEDPLADRGDVGRLPPRARLERHRHLGNGVSHQRRRIIIDSVTGPASE
jgi:hypothetical protein